MTVVIFESRNKKHFVTECIENVNDYSLHVFACGKSAKTGSMMTMPKAMAIAWLKDQHWCKVCRAAIENAEDRQPPTT